MRGLKPGVECCSRCPFCVAPLVGAWIETLYTRDMAQNLVSHPSWVRGLKLKILFYIITALAVAPLVGAWIETPLRRRRCAPRWVAPLVGAWIETLASGIFGASAQSHPSWVRGLKLRACAETVGTCSRTPRGCVD